MGCQEKDQQLKEVTLSLEDVKEDTRKLVEKCQLQGERETSKECAPCEQARKRLQDQSLAIESLGSDNSKLIQMCSSLADQAYTLHFNPPPPLLTLTLSLSLLSGLLA